MSAEAPSSVAAPRSGGGTATQCGELCYLDANNHPLEPGRNVLQVSGFVTNGATLPRGNVYAGGSVAPSDFRVQVADPHAPPGAFATLESRTPSGALRATLQLQLTRPDKASPLRSAYVRLVADDIDSHARGVETRTLRVALRDVVRVKYRAGEQQLEAELRVGQPGNVDAPGAARRARLHIHILRRARAHTPSEPPVIGRNELDALALMRAQVVAANEIWLQCNLTFGDPAETAMEVVAPPPAALLAVANDDGLPARGGGELRFRVDDQAIGPIRTLPNARPVETARSIATALASAGFHAEVTENIGTRAGAGASADVLIRTHGGALVHLEPTPGFALSTDARQSLRIGSVDLSDGLQEFDNMTAQVGTLEERTLIKALADEDPQTIDVFVVSHFTSATRQGEAFIADPPGPITNTVLIDRNGLRHATLAWTLAHELGHVLMNDPLHPDNVGPDRPWLLMDADSGRGTADGPKRLRPQDCQRVRDTERRSRTPLLTPFDREPERARTQAGGTN